MRRGDYDQGHALLRQLPGQVACRQRVNEGVGRLTLGPGKEIRGHDLPQVCGQLHLGRRRPLVGLLIGCLEGPPDVGLYEAGWRVQTVRASTILDRIQIAARVQASEEEQFEGILQGWLGEQGLDLDQ